MCPFVTWGENPSALSNVALSNDVTKKIHLRKKFLFLCCFSKTTLRISRNIWDWMSCFGFAANIQDKSRLEWGGINDNEMMKIGRTYHADYFNVFHYNSNRDYSQMPVWIHLRRLFSTHLSNKQLNMLRMVHCLKSEYSNKS